MSIIVNDCNDDNYNIHIIILIIRIRNVMLITIINQNILKIS